MRAWAIFLLLIFHSVASAAGNVFLKGKLRNFSQSTLEVEVDGWLYTVSKEQINEVDMKKIKDLKTKSPIEFWVSFEAIVDAKKLN